MTFLSFDNDSVLSLLKVTIRTFLEVQLHLYVYLASTLKELISQTG